MTSDAATAKREEEDKWNDEVRKPEIHIFFKVEEKKKKKDKEKRTDDKTVSIILSV